MWNWFDIILDGIVALQITSQKLIPLENKIFTIVWTILNCYDFQFLFFKIKRFEDLSLVNDKTHSKEISQ